MAITKRVRRYPLPGESPFHTFYPKDERLGGFSDAGCGAAERGCGFREEGGTYATVPSAPNGTGRPVEDFLLCAPLRINADEYGLSNIGVKLIDLPENCERCKGAGNVLPAGALEQHPASVVECPECKGLGLVPVTHVWDIIGGEAYPNVADFIEEARRLGISRRLELADGREYARLSPKSRLFLLHKRAAIENPADYYNALTVGECRALVEAGECPKQRDEHHIESDVEGFWIPPRPHTSPGCVALYWHDLEPGTAEAAKVHCARCCGDANRDTDAPPHESHFSGSMFEPWTCPDCHGAGELGYISERFARRSMPSFNYGGFLRPEGVTPLYSLAVFGIFPLARLEVVDPTGGDEYIAAYERASAAKLPVKITDR